MEDLEAAARWADLGFPVSDLCRLYASLAEVEFRRGRWDPVAGYVDRALRLAAELDHGWHVGYAHAVAAHLHAARGDPTAAAGHAADAGRGHLGGVAAQSYASLARAHCAWAAADWPSVTRALGHLVGTSIGNHPNLAVWRLRLAEAWIRLDEPDRAAGLLAEMSPLAWGGVVRSDRLRLQALHRAAIGDDERAQAIFETGLAEMSTQSRSLADGLLALDHGRLLGRTRRRRAAIAPLLVARDVFARLGAVGWLDASESELTRSGVAVDGGLDASSPVQRLTGREQVVAQMMADGLTNREIAAELFVSVKAIEYHVGNIFTKYGIHSRRDVVTATGTRAAASPKSDPRDAAAPNVKTRAT
jgi:DNA-binding CsgD family transcriptional regulator